MATSREQFEQGLKNRTSSVLGFLNRKGPGYQSLPSAAPKPVANTTKTLEELRTQNQPAKAAVQSAYQANKPVVSGSASATSPAKDQFVNRVAAAAPAAPRPAAPGTPGGPDPAMVGGQMMNRSSSPLNQDTFDYQGSIYRTNPDGSAGLVSGMGAKYLDRGLALNGDGAQGQEAPETLTAPERSAFKDDASYQRALSKFNSTGNWGTSGMPGADAAYKDAYTQYIQSLAPGKDSTAARQKYLDFIQSRDLGLQEIEDKPIPMRFITGQQASLQKLAGIEGARLQGDIELTQAADQANQQANLARLNFEQSLLAREDEKNKPIEVGGRLVDPRTGAVVYEPPAGSQGPIELSPGATLYDPLTGQPIFTAPSSSEFKPISVAPGSTLYDPSTGEPIYTAPDKASANKPLSAEAAKVSAIATTIKPEIEQLKDAFRQNYRGAVVGITTGVNRQLVKLVDQVADKVGRLRSGGAINKDEEARFKRQIASFMDLGFGKAEDAIAALDGILNEADTVASSMQAQGAIGSNSGGSFSW